MKGCLITFEGPEGGGKSTQIKRLAQWMEEQGYRVTATREPGGTPIGDRVREILLDPASSDMALRTEMLLYAASRAQLVEQVINPALERGEVVLSDRYVDSSVVYQSIGPSRALDEVLTINRIATGGLMPDRSYILDVPVAESMARLNTRVQKIDRMEGKGFRFHERVREGFLQLSRQEQQRFQVVDATQNPDDVFTEILKDLHSWFPARVGYRNQGEGKSR